MARRNHEFQTIRSEGGLLPPDLLRRVLDPKEKLAGTLPEDYGLPKGERINEVITQSWNRLRKHWAEFRTAAANLPEGEAGTGLTNDKWALPLLRELGFGLLPTSAGPEVGGRSYAISRFFGPVPVHLVGCGLSLDRRAAGQRGAAAANPHGLVQEFLNRSTGHLWAIASNGLLFRVLRDNQALSRQSFLEFDLEAIFTGEVYSDFVLLWLIAHATRFAPRENDRPESCWLEQWTKEAEEQGTRALGDLRGGVERALQIFGEGFTSHPKNTVLRDALRTGGVTLVDFHGQLLRVVYRLIFLFVAEDRTLDGQSLLHPRESTDAARAARQRYASHYSTERLRELASKIKGSRHGDLWRQFQLLVGALSGDSLHAAARQHLALPALGSFLWNPASTATLEGAELTNYDFLEALRHLAFTRQGKVLRPVDYKNLGAEELGGVYESLLALTPQISADGARFSFAEFAGNERKTSGSYYTPDSLVQCLLDSALDPVVEEAIKGKTGAEAEAAILALKVCDPAVGSGHFLVGAAHRLARHLARVRAVAEGEGEPSPLLYQQAVRDVIGRCLYGVDINPMSAELCRVSLWLEALEPGKPLSFLDHHIRVGNSLLGTTPALLAKGIPDEAFTPIEGDDKEICKQLKRRNKDERKGQQFLFDAAGRPWEKLGNVATALMSLDAVDDSTLEGVAQKQQRWEELVRSGSYLSGRLLADAWCAAFVWIKRPPSADNSPLAIHHSQPAGFDDAITEGWFRRIEQNPHCLPPWMRDEIMRLADQYQFFHWHLAFPDVFRVPGPDENPENAQAGWSGGFEIVLGNPPWERLKLQEQEFFAQRDSVVASAPNAATRKRAIAALGDTNPSLLQEFEGAMRRAEGESHLLRDSGRYPLCGRGDINTYAVFAESMRDTLSLDGRLGVIVPTGIATDDTTKFFFGDLVETRTLVSYFGFKNERFLFPRPVEHTVTFGLLTLVGRSLTSAKMNFCWLAWTIEEMKDPARRIVLTSEDIERLNPNTRTCPVFRSERDAELSKAIYARLPVLLRESQGGTGEWGPHYVRLVDYGDHRDELKLQAQCASVAHESSENESIENRERWLPVYESKLVNSYDHRYATYLDSESTAELSSSEKSDPYIRSQPRYWVKSSFFDNLVEKYEEKRPWFLVYRDVARSSDIRTIISAAIPFGPASRKLPVLGIRGDAPGDALLANMNAFVFDYVARQKIGGVSMSFFILKQLPVIPPRIFSEASSWHGGIVSVRKWLLLRVLEQVYNAWDINGFAKDSGWSGPPFRWDEKRRLLLRCELDAAFFHLYLTAAKGGDWCPAESGASEDLTRLKQAFPSPRDAVAYIMDTFPIVRRKDEEKYGGDYRTKRVILEIYDAMQEAIRTGIPYQTRLDPPPGPPADAQGNFLPLPDWKPGQPRPANWPPHIHAPRDVHDWAVANGIDWRTLLDGPPGVLPKPTREPVPPAAAENNKEDKH